MLFDLSQGPQGKTALESIKVILLDQLRKSGFQSENVIFDEKCHFRSESLKYSNRTC